jgi:hypothetical protein
MPLKITENNFIVAFYIEVGTCITVVLLKFTISCPL